MQAIMILDHAPCPDRPIETLGHPGQIIGEWLTVIVLQKVF